jgi:hypothetical protein
VHARNIAMVICSLMFTGSAAHGDWQYTRWGMSPDEVLAASKGQLKRCDAKACLGRDTGSDRALLFGSHSSGEFKFDAFANFDKANKLSRVHLNLINPELGSTLVDALRLRYGEPTRESAATNPVRLFVWRQETDQISVLMVGESTVGLMYEPRLTDSNRGL